MKEEKQIMNETSQSGNEQVHEYRI